VKIKHKKYNQPTQFWGSYDDIHDGDYINTIIPYDHRLLWRKVKKITYQGMYALLHTDGHGGVWFSSRTSLVEIRRNYED